MNLIKNNRRLLIFLFFLVLAGKSEAQSIQIPVTIPPSPAAQTFMRYGEIPIDYSTGVPSIEIPIYTLEGKELKVPISISYHASGIKVNDIASEVGLGWALNCGGMISRTVNGIRDESKSAVRTYANSAQLIDAVNTNAQIYDPSSGNLQGIMDFEDFFKTHYTNEEDLMSDRYFYKLPNGLSGIFTYDYNYMSEDENTAITLPYRPLKIEKFVSGYYIDAKTDGFKITDKDGNTYTFQSYLVNAPNTCSEWFLNQMISADRTDTITFNYIMQTTNSSIPIRSQIYQGEPKEIDNSSCQVPDLSYSLSESTSQSPAFNTPVLASVISSKAIISFTYIQDRYDFNFLKRLSKITIAPRNAPLEIIKIVQFTHKYFGSTAESKRLGLDNIAFGTTGNSQSIIYKFTYQDQVLPPYPTKMTYPKYNEDYWGYYNGSNSNSLIPRDFISNTYGKQAYGGNRDPDPTGYYSKACMLKEIQYPTGGKTAFEFERNYSTNVYPYKTDHSGYVGGFRIGSITNYNENNEITNIKSYEYSGAIVKPVTKELFWYDQRIAENSHDGYGTACWVSSSREMIFSNPILPLEVAPGMPIMYTAVIEYNGTKLNNAGKTVYNYNHPYSPSDFDSNPEHPLEYELPWYYDSYHYDKGNYVPELISKESFSYDGTNYHPLFKEEYEYTKLFTSEFNTGIKLSRPKQYPNPLYFVVFCPGMPCNIAPVINEYIQSVAAIDTKAYREASLLTNVKSYTFDPLDATKYILTSTNNIYNENNIEIKEKSTLSSQGDTLTVHYKYPQDFVSIAPYDKMVNKHIWSTIIEQSKYKNTTDFLQLTKTNYNYWYANSWGNNTANSIIVPQTIETKSKNQATYETRLRYDSYDDKGNVTTVSKENDVKHSYIWGYNKSYPIAEVINAKSNEIFFSGFEEATGWDANLTAYDLVKSHTGKYSGRIDKTTSGELYSMSTNWLNVSLTAPTKYKYSGWVYSNGPSVDIYFFMKRTGENGYFSYVNNILTTVTGKWIYLEKEFEVPADVTQLNIRVDNNADNISAGTSVWFDDIRLHPSASQMTTYTYDPLIGMTSATDPNNRTTYYEYDDFGRLALVKDQDKNILKKICYNYAGQPGDCSVNTDPNWTATGNLRCQTNSDGNTGYQEREEVDQNHSSTTYNQTRWVQDAYNTTACPLPAPPCTITTNYGFTNTYNSIHNNGTSVQFYMVFYSNTVMNPGGTYYVGNIGGSCRPSVTRTINYSSGNQNWTITIYPSGAMDWYLGYGSTPVPAYSTIGTSTLTYNL